DTPEERPDGAGAVVGEAGAEEVVTPLLCPRSSCQVQRMFPTCTVKQSFMIEGGRHAEPAPSVPVARTAQAGDDDGGRERPFDVAVGGLPAALAAGTGDEGLPVPAGGQEGGAHGLRGAAGSPRRGDAGAAGDGGGRARPRTGGGERAAAGGLLPDPDDRPRPRRGRRARAAAPGPAPGDGTAGGRRCLRRAARPPLRRDPRRGLPRRAAGGAARHRPRVAAAGPPAAGAAGFRALVRGPAPRR